MKAIFLTIILSIISTNCFTQENSDKDACPINKMESYILNLKFEKDKCKLSKIQNETILKLREKGSVEKTYHYLRRLNSEVGIFDDD
jgi:hypothetical protein